MSLMPYPWPCVSWWRAAITCPEIKLASQALFEKRSYANRYNIGAANGLLTLSIPVQGGRAQRKPLCDVEISYGEDWQRNHWRSLEAAYRRSPYYEHYAPLIKPLYHSPYRQLIHFSTQTIALSISMLKLGIDAKVLPTSNGTSFNPRQPAQLPAYFQPFIDRNGFISDLSILDLLFCLGPNALYVLMDGSQ